MADYWKSAWWVAAKAVTIKRTFTPDTEAIVAQSTPGGSGSVTTHADETETAGSHAFPGWAHPDEFGS